MSKAASSQKLQKAAMNQVVAPSGILQRKCASCGAHTVAGDKCDECQNKKGVLQRKSSDNSEHAEIPPIINEVLQSSGQPLNAATKTFFEPRFAHNFSTVPVSAGSRHFSQNRLTVSKATDSYEQEADRVANSVMLKQMSESKTLAASEQQGEKFDFSRVRIHTDARAAESARAVSALAYTVGNNIVFGAGQFAPNTHSGRRLIAHELTHVAQQTSGTVASMPVIGLRQTPKHVARQKNPAAPIKFYKEVEDALASVGSRIGTGSDERYLQNVLDLSEAVEAGNSAEATRLTPLVVSASPSNEAPVALSEEFVNDLVTRTFQMGLDAEAASLRTFFRALARAPIRRHPTDTKFGADKKLWEQLVTRAVEQSKFGSTAEASASIDRLLNIFRLISTEAKSIDFKEVLDERRFYHAGDISFYNNDTLGSYFSSLIGQFRNLVVPIFHGVETMMAAAIADLEADKGNAALDAVKAVIDTKILTAYNQIIGDENLLDISVDATRSTFGPKEGKHHDYYDTSAAGKKRSVTISYFDKNQIGNNMMEKTNPVGYIILARKKQISFLEQFYVKANRAAMGKTPLKLESVDDWRNFLHEKVLELQKAGKSNDETLRTIVKFLSDYLETFTTSTPFNIEDVIKQDSENYNKRQFPRAITGQLIEDCGVYALRTVYMLSLVKADLKLRIRFIFLPVHVGLVITGDGLPTLIAHNNKIYPIDAVTLANERKTWAAKDPTKPTTDDQFIGEIGASYFTPGVDVPFRMEDAPAISKDDPKEKEKLQKYYEGTLKRDVLADAPKANISQFHLEYLRLNEETKKMFNGVVVPTWNNNARKTWDKHKDKLFAELAKAREGKSDTYDALSKAYLAELDTTFKSIDTANAALEKSRQDISTTLGAHPELTAPTATRGFGSRVSFNFFWQEQLDTHKKAVADQSDIKSPTKPSSITPPFADAKGLLHPFY